MEMLTVVQLFISFRVLGQLDEVSSDTSGDTGTSDSGRGGSEDDVNIDHIMHGQWGCVGRVALVEIFDIAGQSHCARFTELTTPQQQKKATNQTTVTYWRSS